MHPKPISKSKKEFILQKEDQEFFDFFNEIERSEYKDFFKQLPQVPGFRPDRRAGIEQRWHKFVQNLKNPPRNPNELKKAWDTYELAWVSWVHSHHDLNSLLDGFDNDDDFSEEGKPIHKANSDLDIKCFRYILDANHEGKLSKDSIRRFYEFGYFEIDPKIDSLISQAKSDELIEREKLIDQLPVQIKDLQEEFAALSGNIRDISHNQEQLSKDLEKVKKDSTHDHQDDIKALRKEITGINEKLPGIVQSIEDQEQRGKENLSVITKDLDQLQKRLQMIETQMLPAGFQKKIETEVEVLESKISQLADKIESNDKSQQQLQESIQELKQTIKLQAERNVSPQEPASLPTQQISDIKYEQITKPDYAVPNISSRDNLTSCLANNLQVIGLNTHSSNFTFR